MKWYLKFPDTLLEGLPTDVKPLVVDKVLNKLQLPEVFRETKDYSYIQAEEYVELFSGQQKPVIRVLLDLFKKAEVEKL